jgi:hypothetical protein
MNKVTLVIIISIFIASPSLGQTSPSDSSWLQAWAERYDALSAMQKSGTAKISEKDRLRLIDWLRKDAEVSQRYVDRTGEGLGEGFGDYFTDLTLTVVQLKDPRALPALVLVLDVAPRVETTVAEFGDLAVSPVIDQLANSEERESAVETLGYLLKGNQIGKNNLSDTSVARIKDVLIRLLNDEDGRIRSTAAHSVYFLKPTPELTSKLQQMSIGDRFSTMRGGHLNYPARLAAGDTLQKWGSPTK